MKRIFLICFVLFSITIQAQYRSLSVYAGFQIPNEVAFLDLNGRGPADIFQTGFAAGVSLERNSRFLGFRLDADYTTNRMKSSSDPLTSTEYNGTLRNLYGKAYFNLNFINQETGPRFSLAMGPGFMLGSTPQVTYRDRGLIEGEESVFISSRRPYATLALCSSLRLILPIREHSGLYLALNNDAIFTYGDLELVIYSNLNIGYSWFF